MGVYAVFASLYPSFFWVVGADGHSKGRGEGEMGDELLAFRATRWVEGASSKSCAGEKKQGVG